MKPLEELFAELETAAINAWFADIFYRLEIGDIIRDIIKEVKTNAGNPEIKAI